MAIASAMHHLWQRRREIVHRQRSEPANRLLLPVLAPISPMEVPIAEAPAPLAPSPPALRRSNKHADRIERDVLPKRDAPSLLDQDALLKSDDESPILPAAQANPAADGSRVEAPTPPVVQAKPAAEAKEVRLLLAGLHALRQAHEFGRASSLFKAYLQKYPHGAFAEEVLALSIEAATSRGESARRLAAQYLAQYPFGRFRLGFLSY